MSWETVIGLEVHVQLSTASKIFSGAGTAFGAPPNTQACAIDLALPGTLPVLNAQAVNYAIMFGLAINADIEKHAVFERKNYFYPDLPKGYQTSQMAAPIIGPGFIDIPTEDGELRVRIHHAHLEEDAGKSLHEDFHGMSGIDLNRAGTPLLEIVSEPDMRSAEQAVAYMRKIHAIVTYLGISDGDLSQGSLRCDANVSVRRPGAELGTRAELKNINSFRFIERAINVEVARQIDILEDGGSIKQETRLYDSDRNETRPMRSKEEANDYRYFPCPDLLPLDISDDDIERMRAQMPELPDARRLRLQNEYQLSDYDAALITEQRALADYFETLAKGCGDAKAAANWINGELAAALNRDDLEITASPVTADQLAQLIARINDNTVSGKIAKQIFEALWNGEGESADVIIDARGLKQSSDSGEIEAWVDQVLAENAEQVAQFREADDKKRKKMLGYFVGQIMKISQGQANPGMVNKILQQKL